MRIDEHARFDGVRLLVNDQWHWDGPYWIERTVGDLGYGHALAVTNGRIVFPFGAVMLSVGPIPG